MRSQESQEVRRGDLSRSEEPTGPQKRFTKFSWMTNVYDITRELSIIEYLKV